MAKNPERTYFTKAEMRGIYQGGRKVAEPVMDGTPRFYTQE